MLAQAVLQDAARENFASMDRSRISVILGVTSAQELLFSMVSRLQRPVWVKALRESVHREVVDGTEARAALVKQRSGLFGIFAVMGLVLAIILPYVGAIT